jgi:hypothetical protein
MELGLTVSGSVASNQADIWFLLNGTDPNASSGRRGQKVSVYPTGTGVLNRIMSTSWTFSVLANDTILSLAWMDVAGSLGTSVFGNSTSARLTVVEV